MPRSEVAYFGAEAAQEELPSLGIDHHLVITVNILLLATPWRDTVFNDAHMSPTRGGPLHATAA